MAIEMIKRCDYCGKVEVMKEVKTEEVQAYLIDAKVIFENKTIASMCSRIGDACEECRGNIFRNLHVEYLIKKAGLTE